ncbi:uncharacterized protein LOC111030076 [Myzus persicae]|uniref:uncharacterized protein LOC111030076 n=1 Tax=Myzus persicae TaxID=13164 RepID=UPI000B93966F|nr:uncharacterized protein LOC111030076 [Myzus persicae]
MANLSIAMEKKKSNRRCKLSIGDEENFEPPIQSSTPSKMSKKHSKRILKDNNSLNISVINKHYQNKTINVTETDCQQYKPILPVIEENIKYGRVPELFYSDPEDEPTETENETATTTNDSDDKWTTFSDVSEDRSCSNVTDLLAEIEADVDIRFKKPPRRSYPGRKRNNISLFEDKEEEEIDVQIQKKCKKHRQKKKDPQEEAFVQSMNEHFGDIESFNLAVE